MTFAELFPNFVQDVPRAYFLEDSQLPPRHQPADTIQVYQEQRINMQNNPHGLLEYHGKLEPVAERFNSQTVLAFKDIRYKQRINILIYYEIKLV